MSDPEDRLRRVLPELAEQLLERDESNAAPFARQTTVEGQPGFGGRLRVLAGTTVVVLVAVLGFRALSASSSGDAASNEPVRSDVLRVLDVEIGGAEVSILTLLNDVPENATEVEMTVTVIEDRPEGPVACLGPQEDSNPPQCDGLAAINLEVGDWAKVEAGVAYGKRTLQFSWPIEKNQLNVLADSGQPTPGSEGWPRLRSGNSLPTECNDFHNSPEWWELDQWGQANPDRAGHFFVEGSTMTGALGIKGDLEAARAEIADATNSTPCLFQVDYTFAELTELANTLRSNLGYESDLVLLESLVRDKLNIELLVADRENIQKVLDLTPNPDMVRITGRARILNGIIAE